MPWKLPLFKCFARISSKTKIGRIEVAPKRSQEIYEETLHSLLRIYRVLCLRFSSPGVLLLMRFTTLYSSRAYSSVVLMQKQWGFVGITRRSIFTLCSWAAFFLFPLPTFAFAGAFFGWNVCQSKASFFANRQHAGRHIERKRQVSDGDGEGGEAGTAQSQLGHEG